MASEEGTPEERAPAEIRREIERERNELLRSVEQLRAGVKEATDVRSKLLAHLPVATVGALAAGFVLSGGIPATLRLVFRRPRDG
jgi:uncharacterized protein DUF3618/malonyl-CoA decarboxylase-like protein